MSRSLFRLALSIAGLASLATTIAGCENPVLDHYWDYDRCQATFVKAGTTTPVTQPAAAYLRRANGASALLIELSDRGGIGSPYSYQPTIRFAIPRDAGPSSLHVVPDGSDVRGPVKITPGTAWLLSTPTVDQTKPGDNWRLGEGTLSVAALTLTENDTSARDFVTLDADLDLSGVLVKPIGSTDPATETVGGALHLHCGDQSIPFGSAGGAGGVAGAAGSTGAGAMGGSDAGGAGGSAGSAGGTSLPAGTMVTTDAAAAISTDGTSVAWLVRMLQPGFVDSGVARLSVSGGAATDVAAGMHFVDTDRVVVSGTEVFFTTIAGLWRAAPPSPANVLVSTTPTNVARIVGVTATHVYLAYVGEAPPFTPVRRFNRATGALEAFACVTASFMDGAVDANGALFVASPSNVSRYDTPTATGAKCTTASPSQLVAGVTTGQSLARILVGPTRLVYVTQGQDGVVVHSVDSQGIQAPVTLGTAAVTSQGVPPIAMNGDTVFWVDGTKGTPGAAHAIVASPGDASVAPVPLAGEAAEVLGMAASSTTVAWFTGQGVYQIAR